VILVERTALEEIIGGRPFARAVRKGKIQRLPVSLNVEVTSGDQLLTTENVLAYIAGSDKSDELVVLTAHYDHVGVKDGVVYNGADDDGSGTVAMIEIAEAFAQAKAAGHGPRRSVLVMAVSGEEKGLLGSRYYSEHPVFPLSNTVADLNIDMIGRRDSAHQASAPYVHVIGSDRLSSGLHEANERANKTYTKLDLDYTFNAEHDPNRFYYRSDHYNFARKGIPSLFYFSGIHEDYHQPGDDAEKIDLDLLHQRTLLAFHTAWILANQERRIEVDKPVKP
jgi:Zn-dependent M28 family amino/carboxypeptidase